MFIVISVATNCAYIFIDAWRQSTIVDPAIIPVDDKKKRMAYAFRRVFRATSVSSLTTAAAMVPNVFSLIMPLKSFGIFATIIVIVVYLEILLVLPPAVLVYEQRMEQLVPMMKKVMQKLKEKVLKQNREGMLQELPRPEVKSELLIQDFFEQHFTQAVYKLRLLILVLFGLAFGICMGWTAQLGRLTVNEALVNEDHPELYPFKIFEQRLIKEHEVDYIDVHFVFGVNSIDTSHPNPSEKVWDSDYRGQLIWDINFDVASVNSQKYLFDLCHYFFNFYMTSYEKVSCWMFPFARYVKQRGLEFPMKDRNEYHKVLEEWSETDEGQVYFHERKEVYLVDSKVKFFKIVAKSNLTYYNATADDRAPQKRCWEEFT